MNDDIIPLATRRVEKTTNSKDWTPRDVLIEALRQIDNGILNVSELIVCYNHVDKDGSNCAGYYRSGTSSFFALGVMQQVQNLILKA